MKIWTKVISALLLVFAAASSPTYAATIIDTGVADNYGSMNWRTGNFRAGQISLDDATSIMSVGSWFGSIAQTDTGTLRLYADDSDSIGDQVYSIDFTFDGAVSGFFLIDGLDWSVSAGTYWIGFISGSTFGRMALVPPNPLDLYAGSPGGAQQFGLVVNGEVVPLPAAAWLMIGGLATLLGFRRR